MSSTGNDLVGSFDNSGSFATFSVVKPSATATPIKTSKKEVSKVVQSTKVHDTKVENTKVTTDDETKTSFSQILPATFAHQIGQLVNQQQQIQADAIAKAATVAQRKSTVIRRIQKQNLKSKSQ